MTQASQSDFRKVAESREAECETEAQAYRDRLSTLSWTNWITIVLPALLSTFAGASVFAETAIDWKLWSGTAALLSGLLVAVHKGRNCDAYQAECRRLAQAYSSLAAKYRTLHQLDSDQALTRTLDLDAKLAAVRETATADVPESYRTRASAKLGLAKA